MKTVAYDETKFAIVPIEADDRMIAFGINTPCALTGDDDADSINDYKSVYRSMIKAAPPYPESNFVESLDSWIPVSQRLPDIATPVLALVGKNTYALARIDYEEGWLWSIGGSDLSDVRNYEADDDYQPTHWMYIPAAPKGEE